MNQNQSSPVGTYKDTIRYLFSRLPMFSHIGIGAFKKDLINTLALCTYFDNPQKKFKSIHIAGTNGKGSVSHMLASIFQAAGYKTGLYTSPHLKDFRERIKIDGHMISEDFVVGFTESVKPMIDKIEPSFFEITVAMAFEYFVKEQVDIAIIETGLGGRFDSTNVITPEVSVITNIGWDHMNILGNSLQEIAFEKAGIIKKNIPVVIGELLPETKPVFEKVAGGNHSPVFVANEKRRALNWKWEKHELLVEIEEQNHTDHELYHLDLPGLYQTKNVITVLETCDQMIEKGWIIDKQSKHSGLQHTKKTTGLHGRWELIHQNPSIVLDVAHNEDGIRMLMEQVEVSEFEHLHIVIGVVKDKAIDRVLSLLPKLASYYFTQSNIPRALETAILKSKASESGLHGDTYPDVNSAIDAAKAKAGKNDLILVCGSVFLVGEVNI